MDIIFPPPPSINTPIREWGLTTSRLFRGEDASPLLLASLVFAKKQDAGYVKFLTHFKASGEFSSSTLVRMTFWYTIDGSLIADTACSGGGGYTFEAPPAVILDLSSALDATIDHKIELYGKMQGPAGAQFLIDPSQRPYHDATLIVEAKY